MKSSQIYKSGAKYKPYLLSMLIIGIGYGFYKGVLDNYLANIVNMNQVDRGLTEFFREMPGFLLVFILAFLYKLSAQSVFRLGSVFFIAGLAVMTQLPTDKILVIVAMFIISTGEHFQYGMENVISIDYAAPGCSGQALGRQTMFGKVGNIAGYFFVIFLFGFLGDSIGTFKISFIIAFSFVAVGSFFSLFMGSTVSSKDESKRFVLKKKFTKYYMLELFYGARKQVFFTFGPYVLILHYGAPASVISLLFAIASIADFIFSPIVGKIIDKVGYKIVMIMDTLILVIVCFFYGFADKIFPRNIAFVICCVNYVLDSVISLASMASSVYVKDLSDNPQEVKATLTTGLSINHLITIFIALFGGWVWRTLGIEMLFILSAVLGLCNSAYAATIKMKDGHAVRT